MFLREMFLKSCEYVGILFFVMMYFFDRMVLVDMELIMRNFGIGFMGVVVVVDVLV